MPWPCRCVKHDRAGAYDGPLHSQGREKARELLTEAIDLYREIGMPKHLEMAEELLAGAWTDPSLCPRSGSHRRQSPFFATSLRNS